MLATVPQAPSKPPSRPCARLDEVFGIGGRGTAAVFGALDGVVQIGDGLDAAGDLFPVAGIEMIHPTAPRPADPHLKGLLVTGADVQELRPHIGTLLSFQERVG